MKLLATLAASALLITAHLLHAQTACDASLPQRDAAKVAALRTNLRATKQDKDDIGYEAPPSVEQQLPQLKDALALAVRETLACMPVDTTPAQIESKLTALLHANAPQPAPGSIVSNGDPRYKEALSFEWSANLLLHVTAPQPNLLQVEFSFAISCGEDTVLLLFERTPAGYREALRWQAAPYKEINQAFGDGFLTAILTPRPGQWRVVSVHGNPWCTSRMSAFDIDVLEPTADPDHPRIVWHAHREYSRSDYAPKLKLLAPDTFELRNHADEMGFNDDGFERLVVYRYRFSGDTLARLEPIAGNARGFVEEWLAMPWDEAAAQAASEALSALRPLHRLSEDNLRDGNKIYTSFAAGPVRACAAKGRYQVAFTSQAERTSDFKATGPSEEHYFQLLEFPNGYRLLNLTSQPDPTCKGTDLMHSTQ